IDKSFTQNLIGNKFDQAIVKSLVSLGREFQFKVIAEGVELLEQSQLLHSLGCNLVQGHLYSKAVCAADVPALLSKLNSEATRPVLKKTA
ncbi:MAG: EAL domain-containing protein, partial [Rhizobiales bacterium]|nr:EAL domain-containing protein [Hyphomicrobiales bacterium]